MKGIELIVVPGTELCRCAGVLLLVSVAYVGGITYHEVCLMSA